MCTFRSIIKTVFYLWSIIQLTTEGRSMRAIVNLEDNYQVNPSSEQPKAKDMFVEGTKYWSRDLTMSSYIKSKRSKSRGYSKSRHSKKHHSKSKGKSSKSHHSKGKGKSSKSHHGKKHHSKKNHSKKHHSKKGKSSKPHQEVKKWK